MSEIDELDAGFQALAEAAAKQQPSAVSATFYVDAIHNEAKSKQAGRPIFDDTEMVSIQIAGERDVLRRPVTNLERTRYAAQYLAWKRKQNQDEAEGLPLRQWTLVTAAQAEELRHFGIRTVEQLALCPDVTLQKVGPLMQLRQKARDWMERAKDEAVLSRLRTENEDLRSRLTTLEGMLEKQAAEIDSARKNGGALPALIGPDPRIAEMQAQLAALAAFVKPNGEPPKRRGRPPGSKNKPKSVPET